MTGTFSIAPQLIGAYLFTFGGAISMIGLVTILRRTNQISSLVARKLMHMSTGPVFVLCWLLFPQDNPYSRYIAGELLILFVVYVCSATVPAVVTLYFVANGLSLANNEHFIKSISRTGDRKELLKGPLLYGIVHVVACAVYFTDVPTGMITLICLCVGDGLADLLGRKYGKNNKLPWNRNKSWAGSASFFFSSVPLCWLVGRMFFALGHFAKFAHMPFIYPVSLLVAVSTLVESFTMPEIDNVTVFLAGAFVGALYWQ